MSNAIDYANNFCTKLSLSANHHTDNSELQFKLFSGVNSQLNRRGGYSKKMVKPNDSITVKLDRRV